MRTLIAIWLPTTFTLFMLSLVYFLWPYGHSEVFFVPALFGFADALARYRDYRRILRVKSMFKNGLPFHHLCKRYRSSRCQRHACVAALGKPAADYFRSWGYRWYHLLPDGTFTKDSPYLKRSFYKTLLCGT